MDPIQPDELMAAKRSIMRVNHQRSAGSSRRHRAVLSCAPCRKRKIKCDRLKPCGQCVRSNTKDTCTYPLPPATPSLSPLESTAANSKRLRLVRHAQNPDFTRNSSTGLGTPVSFNAPEYGKSRHSIAGGRVPARDFSHLSSPLATTAESDHGVTPERVSSISHIHSDDDRRPIPPSSADSFTQSLAPLSFRGKQQRTRFFGRSHWATTLGMFPDLNAHLHDYYRNKQSPTNPEFAEYLSLKRLKQDLRGPFRRWRCDQNLHSVKLKELLPGRGLSEYLMQLYFSSFEYTFRILHVPSFVGEWNAFWNHLEMQSDDSLSADIFIAKLLALMACSGCFASGEPIESAGLNQQLLMQMCHRWIDAVAAWLGLMRGHAQLSLDVIQIKCLLLFARQATAWEGDLVGMAAGSLIREAMLMGLHREPSNFSDLSPYWAEMRKRLWLTIIELELQVSLYCGIPLAINWDEFDCSLPSNLDDEDFSVESRHLPSSKPPTTLTRTSFQIVLAQTLRTRMRVSKIVNRVRLSEGYDDVFKLSESLTTGLSHAPPELRDITSTGNSAGGNECCLAFRKSFFLFLHYRCLLALHRPFFLRLAETLGEPFVFSRRVCVQTSLALLAQLEHSPRSLPDEQPASGRNFCSHVLQLKGGMFRDDVFHAATTICFELRLQAKDRVIDPFPGTISGFMDQSAFYQRLALFGSVENAVKYFEFKVCTEKRATKAFTILNMLLTSIKSQMLAAEGFSRLDGTSDGTVLTIDDACPLASRRCRELLLGDGTSNASGANREGHHEPLQSADHASLPVQGPDLGTTVRPDSSHHTNESRNSMQPTIMEEDVTGGNLRDLDLDWYFSLDPLSPYPINTWSELDPLTI